MAVEKLKKPEELEINDGVYIPPTNEFTMKDLYREYSNHTKGKGRLYVCQIGPQTSEHGVLVTIRGATKDDNPIMIIPKNSKIKEPLRIPIRFLKKIS
jgi:hypothetical protein